MDTSSLLHEQLLQVNQDAFEQGLYLVAYHALAGALQCAIVPPNQDKHSKLMRLRDIEERVIAQMTQLNHLFTSSTFKDEGFELSLYASVAQSVTTQLVFLRVGF